MFNETLAITLLSTGAEVFLTGSESSHSGG